MEQLPMDAFSQNQNSAVQTPEALLAELDALVAVKQLRRLDAAFARFLLQQGASCEIACLGALVSFALSQGHSCLPLAWLHVPGQLSVEAVQLAHKWLGDAEHLQTSGLPLDGPLNNSVDNYLGDGSQLTPLVLQHNAVYLYRYFAYERDVAAQLIHRAGGVTFDPESLSTELDALFPTDEHATDADWQKLAAYIAVTHRLGVISGGPGTGKTTTVIKLLALLVTQASDQTNAAGSTLNIKLAAPTGKAAARLSESITGAKAKLGLTDDVAQAIPDEASTLHRLLGVIPNSHEFRHHAGNPLHLDVLVVDEASMVDLSMMARLLDALPVNARLILLGDRDQLASVEAGSVLADLCMGAQACHYSQSLFDALSRLSPAGSVQEVAQAAQSALVNSTAVTQTLLTDSVAFLRKSYRFDEKSGIGVLANAVNRGEAKAVSASLRNGFEDIDHLPLSSMSYETMVSACAKAYNDYLETVNSLQATPESMLAAFSGVQLLCALREGPYGVAGLNREIEAHQRKQNRIKSAGIWYAGRPVIITRNEPNLDLYNGDIGIALPSASGDSFDVWFEAKGGVRSVLASRLPEHETVFAMTIHKSQGSEFGHVLMVLPPKDTPVLTRELVYTGITRAKRVITLLADERVLIHAARRLTERASNLAQRLCEKGAS